MLPMEGSRKSVMPESVGGILPRLLLSLARPWIENGPNDREYQRENSFCSRRPPDGRACADTRMGVTGSRLRPCYLGHREKQCQCCRFGDLFSKTRTSLRSPGAADRSNVRPEPESAKKESATSATSVSSRSAAQAARAGRFLRSGVGETYRLPRTLRPIRNKKSPATRPTARPGFAAPAPLGFASRA